MESAPTSAISPERNSSELSRQRFVEKQPANRTHDDTDDLMADVKAWIVFKNQHFFAREIDPLPSKESSAYVDDDYTPDYVRLGREINMINDPSRVKQKDASRVGSFSNIDGKVMKTDNVQFFISAVLPGLTHVSKK
uniref:DDE_Tnp_1_7 domain-containing protein n=1 Tax=Haemonchus contortus TaxID=6289 RepID=A0A7I4Y4W3_HAECO